MKSPPCGMMGGMDDLIAFLNARLDEDEAAAMAAAKYPGKDWENHPGRGEGESVVFEDAGSPFGWIDSAGAVAIGEHIARHDPDHTLREVAAKRAIIEWWERGDPQPGDPAPSATYEHYRRSLTGYLILRVLAVYSDHPGYREEWAP